jgi:5-methylcytosine-specific restriction endonuclease McrA
MRQRRPRKPRAAPVERLAIARPPKVAALRPKVERDTVRATEPPMPLEDSLALWTAERRVRIADRQAGVVGPNATQTQCLDTVYDIHVRICLDCPATFTGTGSRCDGCSKAKERVRNGLPSRRAYQDPAYQAIPLGGTCWLCGEPGADTRDHVVSIARGGTNAPSNIRPAHRACNSSKGAA